MQQQLLAASKRIPKWAIATSLAVGIPSTLFTLRKKDTKPLQTTSPAATTSDDSISSDDNRGTAAASKKSASYTGNHASNHSIVSPSISLNHSSTTSPNWQSTLEKTVPAIVSLKINSPRTFDTEAPGSGCATGFVVDAEGGIILTNRHVVGTGPVVAEAVFHNNEEIDVTPMYRDPVHDFGFFKYDPAKLRFMKDIKAVPLCPEKAIVGTDIRVVGNNAAEKLSISSSTLARIDRVVPAYGADKYNDFNTFYFQAATGTSGGSSGSPVLNNEGEAIALNAGGKMGTSASFYLPLDRVKRTYECLRDGNKVSRGTIQTVFVQKPFDELRRLGVRVETEAAVRSAFPDVTGMLTIKDVVPSGPAGKKLQPGDVLVRVNDKLVTTFIPLEEVLDENPGSVVKIEVERAGTPLTFDLTVDDLHRATPSKYFQIGGSLINPLSYHQSLYRGMKIGLPFLAYPGYMFSSALPPGCVLLEVDGEPCTYESLKEFFSTCKDGQKVRVKYSGRSKSSIAVITIDKKWFPFVSCDRNDTSMTWDCETIRENVASTIKTSDNKTTTVPSSSSSVAETQMLKGKNAVESKIADSMVTVHFSRPFPIDSLPVSSYIGAGLVVDAEKGLVVVDRNTVPDHAGDVSITIANTVSVPAKVSFVHPVHNFAIIQYDPKRIGNTPIKSCEVAEPGSVKPSKEAWLVGLTASNSDVSYSELVSRETIISGVKWVNLPLPSPPKYQEHNLEMVHLQDTVSTMGGVVSTPEGKVAALWCSFSFGAKRQQLFNGIPMDIIMESVRPLITDSSPPKLWDLGVDFNLISLAKGRQLGLSDRMVSALEAHAPQHRSVLTVMRRWGGSDASDKLQDGDLIVAIDGKFVMSFREVELATQKPEVEVTVVRGDSELSIPVKTYYLESGTTNRLLFWQGMIVQDMPLSVISQRKFSKGQGVYITGSYLGSPAGRYGPPPTSRICEINGEKIKNLDDFLRVIQLNDGQDFVRIRYMDMRGKKPLSTLKLETKYWPTSELIRDDSGEWTRVEHHNSDNYRKSM